MRRPDKLLLLHLLMLLELVAQLLLQNQSLLLNIPEYYPCLLYTSDAADDLLCVDLGGRRIIKKKNKHIKKEVIKPQ